MTNTPFYDSLMAKIEAFEKRYGGRKDVWATAQWNDEFVIALHQAARLRIYIAHKHLAAFATWTLSPDGEDWLWFHNNSLVLEMVETFDFVYELNLRGLLEIEDEDTFTITDVSTKASITVRGVEEAAAVASDYTEAQKVAWFDRTCKR